jgi:hypothetical protein
MAQVTIYVEDSALQAAREAAARAQMSLSQWFAQFAAEEKRRRTPNWDAFFAELDALQAAGDDDFPSLESIRAREVPDLPREAL